MEDRGKKVAVALVVGFLMVSSVIGFAVINFGQEGETKLKYKGHTLTRLSDGTVITKVSGKELPFTYFPAEIESIPMESSIAGRINSTRMVFVTSDYYSNNSQVIGLIEYDLMKALAEKQVFVVQGFTENATRLPVVTCRNSTKFVPVIFFSDGNSTSIHYSGECIIVQADSYDGFVKARDRLLYGIFGVMDG